MKRHPRLCNLIVLTIVVFLVILSKTLTLERFQGLVLIIAAIMILAFQYKIQFLLNIFQKIYNLFDEKDINFHFKWVKILSICTVVSLVCIFPLTFFVSKTILSYSLIAIISIYEFTYIALIIFLLISAKTIFYSLQPLYDEKYHGANIVNNTINNFFIKVVTNNISFVHQKFIDYRVNNNSSTHHKFINYEINNSIVIEDKRSKNCNQDKAILEDFFDKTRPMSYLPIFKLVDNLFFHEALEKNEMGRWYDTITKLTNGKRDSITTSYYKKNTITHQKIIDLFCVTLKSKGINKVIDFDKYIHVSTLCIDEFISNGLPFNNETKKECIQLLTLYISYLKEDVQTPILPETFDIETKTALWIKLKKYK